MPEAVHYELQRGVACITLQQPPVNALSLAVRQQLLAALRRAAADPHVVAVVLRGSGRGFSAGADIREFGTLQLTATPSLIWDVHPAIEHLSKPVVAAVHGMAIGGGLETALACHLRVAVANTLVALPEVSLGVIPLVATQRLPRLLPLQRVIDLILTGSRHTAGELSATALFDEIVADPVNLESRALELALHAAGSGQAPARVCERSFTESNRKQVLHAALEDLAGQENAFVRRAALEAIEHAVTAPDFTTGLERANVILQGLLSSSAAREAAQRFLAPGSGGTASS